MSGASMDHCPKQEGGLVDTERCGTSISGKAAAEVLHRTAEQLMLLSQLDAEEQLHVVATQLWRQLFETLKVIGVTDADFRNMLLTSGPALWVSLSNSVRKVTNVLQAPLHWRISKEYQKDLTWDVSSFSVLSVGAAIFWMRYGRAVQSGQHNRTATFVERGGNRFNIIAKGASLGLGFLAAAGTFWFALRRHLTHNRVYLDYHVILEHVFTFLSASDDASAIAASLPTGQLEIAIAKRCQELDLSSCSVDEGSKLPKLSASAALLDKDTRKDIVLRAKLLEKVAHIRSLLENYLARAAAPGPGDVALAENGSNPFPVLMVDPTTCAKLEE